MVPIAQFDRAALMRAVYESLEAHELNGHNNVQVAAATDGDGQDCILVKVGRTEYHVTVRKIW